MRRPTIILIHGAFHRPSHFSPLKTQLEAHNYRVLAPALPSTLYPGDEPQGIAADISVIRSTLLDELDSQGNDALLVMHSYGGIPGCSALEDLDRESRRSQGKETCVRGIVGIAAFLKANGEGFVDGLREGDAPNVADLDESGTRAVLKPEGEEQGPEFWYYHDLESEEGKSKWVRELGDMSVAAVMGKCGFTAWEGSRFEVSYLLTVDDRVLSVGAQREMVARVRREGGRIWSVKEVEAGHSVFLSQVQETADFLRECAGEDLEDTR